MSLTNHCFPSSLLATYSSVRALGVGAGIAPKWSREFERRESEPEKEEGFVSAGATSAWGTCLSAHPLLLPVRPPPASECLLHIVEET